MKLPKTQWLTEEEAKTVIRMAIAGAPQTDRQLYEIVKEAEAIRTQALLLEGVLAGDICMFKKNGETQLCRRSARPPTGTELPPESPNAVPPTETTYSAFRKTQDGIKG